MEPNQNNIISTPLPASNPKKHLISRILKITIVAVGLYIVIGFVLILINPLFIFIVLYPVFAIQSMFGQAQNSALENNLEKVPASSVVMAAELTKSDCVGLFGTEGFMNNNYPGISEYAQKLEADRFTTVGVCKTAKGTFVAKSSYENGGETYLNQVYFDDAGELKKLLEFGDTVVEFAEDTEGNVFLLVYKDIEGHVSRQLFAYDVNNKAFLKVTQTPDVFKVCTRTNKDQCAPWRVRNFPATPKANYNSTQQEQEYKTANPVKTKTAAQLNCIEEFTKKSGRSSGNLGNIKLVTDLNEEPLYSCVTDPSKKPFDFNIYLFGNEKAGAINETINGTPTTHFYDINYALFDMSSENKVVSYHVSYPGFDLYNYALDSISYQVFKNIIAGKYKVGELIPDIDNTEAGWSGFTPRASFTSIDKENYRGTDIYTIKGATRYKAFLLGKTYVLIRYDGHLNAAINDATADIVAKRIVDSKPYVPIKISKLSLPAGEQSFDVVAKAFLSKSLEYAKSFYAKHQTYEGLCADQDFSRTTSLLMYQFPTDDYGTNCSSSGQVFSLGVYFETQSGLPSKIMYVDAQGNYSK